MEAKEISNLALYRALMLLSQHMALFQTSIQKEVISPKMDSSNIDGRESFWMKLITSREE